MLIDTHVHLNNDRLFDELDKHIEEAIEANVLKMICIGYDKASSQRAIDIATQYSEVYAAIGIHPSEVKKATIDDLGFLENNILHPRVVAVGEIGLDYYWDKSFSNLQQEYFELQLELAKKYQKPVVIHSREASLDTYTILEKHKVPGVMHCYSSSVEMARRFIDLGMFIGIGGVVTFHNSKIIKEVVEKIDLKHILTETDAPYLAPMPYRGKLNKPKYIREVVKKISEIKHVSFSQVEEQIESNVKKLFKI